MKKALAILMVLAMCVCAAALFIDDDAAADTTYTLNYGGNGEGLPASQTATSASSPYNMTVSNTVPTRTGYTFLGWATSALNASKGIVAYVGGDTIQLTNMNNTKTIYSTWEYDDTPLNGVNTTTGSGTQADPYTFIDIGAHSGNILNSSYVLVGSSITVTNDDYDDIDYNVNNVTSGHGLTVNYQGVSGTLTGTAGQTVTITVDWVDYGSDSGTYYHTFTIASAQSYNYSLSYNANGGSGAPSTQSQSSTASSYSFIVSNTAPTRSGYTFLGWADSADAVAAQYYGGDTITLQSNSPTKTIYAVWQQNTYSYTLSYNANGGSGAPSTQSQSSTASSYSFTVSNTAPTRSGYTFLGWGNTSDATVAIYSGGDTITLQSSSPTKTIYAVWYRNPSVTGSGTQADPYTYLDIYGSGAGILNSSYVKAGTSVTITNNDYDDIDYNVNDVTSGHGLSVTGSGLSGTLTGSPGDTVTIVIDYVEYGGDSGSYSYTFTIVDDVTYTLTYDANSGSGAPTAQTATTTELSKAFTLHSGQPTRSGYTFLGWADSADAVAAQYYGGDSITLYAGAPTKTIYAVWSEESITYTYTLTYDANGGSDAPAAESQTTTAVSYSFTVSNAIPTRADYDFLGWADSADAVAAQYIGGNSIVLNSADPTKTIYAVWIEQGHTTYTYTLKFNGNGGSGVPVTMTAIGTALTYSFTIPDIKPVKDGVVFAGWSLAPSASSAQYTPGATIPVSANQEVTLYAVWNDDNSFSFSFDFLIKQIANTFFGGSSSMAGLAMIVICWLLLVAVLANFKAPISYSVAPMIPVVIIFAAMGIISTDITMIVIVVCAVFSAVAVRNIVQGD